MFKITKPLNFIIWIIITAISTTWFIHGFKFHDKTASTLTIITSFTYVILSLVSKCFQDWSFIKDWFDDNDGPQVNLHP
jgi:hypothetical protein